MAAARDVKLCLLGDSKVGKSSIVHRFVFDTFNPLTDKTIGAAFFSKTVEVKDVTFRFQIWDTAGEEKYRALTPMYYRDAAAAVVVYDITDQPTFMAVKMWINELQRHANPSVLIVVGNKCDLESKREVDKAEAGAFASNHGAIFFETSAKDSVNIAQLFTEIGEHLVPADQHSKLKSESREDIIRPVVESEPKRSNCCQK